MLESILFTLFQVIWAIAWASLHLWIRKARGYSVQKIQMDTNKRYKLLSLLMFLLQITVSIACFWFDTPVLLKFHNSDLMRVVGVALMLGATWLYISALRHLGKNYSPCYDAYLPQNLVSTGPYQCIRHPMYLAKLGVVLGTILLSGSGWFLLPSIVLAIVTLRSLEKEERYLAAGFPAFKAYQSLTSKLVPGIY